MQKIPVFDFDKVEEWGPRLLNFLGNDVPPNIAKIISNGFPQYIEDASYILFKHSNKNKLYINTSNWLKTHNVRGFHGTRITAKEQKSILQEGLKPLVATERTARLIRSLSRHSRWPEIEQQLNDTIKLYGAGENLGKREGQAHLTVSCSALINSFNHYLVEGSEFDSHVAYHLLGEEGKKLISSDGNPFLVSVLVPGEYAFEACNRFGIPSDGPNLIRQMLHVWSYWLAYPDFRSSKYELDCGMVFEDTIPPGWIESVTQVQ
jgi:hypothetical protein